VFKPEEIEQLVAPIKRHFDAFPDSQHPLARQARTEVLAALLQPPGWTSQQADQLKAIVGQLH